MDSVIQFALWKVKFEKVKVLKEHTFVKRVQNDTYIKYKAELFDGDLLVHVHFAESYRNNQQNEIKSAYFGNQVFALHIVLLF